MSASGHSENGMFALYQSQSRLSQKVSRSRSFCLSRIWAGAGRARNSSATKDDRVFMSGAPRYEDEPLRIVLLSAPLTPEIAPSLHSRDRLDVAQVACLAALDGQRAVLLADVEEAPPRLQHADAEVLPRNQALEAEASVGVGRQRLGARPAFLHQCADRAIPESDAHLGTGQRFALRVEDSARHAAPGLQAHGHVVFPAGQL